MTPQPLLKFALWLSLLVLLAGCAPIPPTAAPTLQPPTGPAPGSSDGQSPATPEPSPTAPSPVATSASPDTPVSSDRPFIPRSPAWEPQPGDEKLKRSEAFIDEFNLLVLESFPPQYNLNLRGALPTPCHKLRILVHPPDNQKRILIEVYSLLNPDPNLVCIQVLEPFDATLTLEVTESGHYTVWINDQQIAEFDHP